MTIKNEQKNQKLGIKNGQKSKRNIEHSYKLGLMRDCQIYGKGFDECKQYFKSKGYSLGRTQFTELRNELKSTRFAKDWFSKEALYVIEEDHMLSTERIRFLEDDILAEYCKTKVAELKLKIISQFESLQLTKTKIFSATPLVQEMMEIRRREEEDEHE